MNQRRQMLLALSAFLIYPHCAWSEMDEDLKEVLLKAIQEKNPVLLGHIVPPPDDPVWLEVDRILANSPRPQVTPYEVASYFTTSIPQKFQYAWPEPDAANPTAANPLIVRFFLSTGTVPEGDTTAWCAAFANWCLKRANIVGTNSASSQSFASWGESVWNKGDSELPVTAKRGDIAVFRKRTNPKLGHVAFYVDVDSTQANRVRVLGGNQFQRQNHLWIINTDSLRVNSDLELISIRTKTGLRHT